MRKSHIDNHRSHIHKWRIKNLGDDVVTIKNIDYDIFINVTEDTKGGTVQTSTTGLNFTVSKVDGVASTY